MTDEHPPYLDDFSVTAAYRNKGIGSALVGAAEAYADRIGSRAVLLHVEKTNTSAMRFYERSGYAVFRDDGNRLLLKKDSRTGQNRRRRESGGDPVWNR